MIEWNISYQIHNGYGGLTEYLIVLPIYQEGAVVVSPQGPPLLRNLHLDILKMEDKKYEK